MNTTSEFELSYIVPLFFNQKNNNTLVRMLSKYSKYNQKLLNKIHFILIDDCSPAKIELPEISNMNVSLLRITSDIMWNQGGARNLGAYYAMASKLVMTDVDHVFPERTLAHFIKRKCNYNDIFRFRKFNGLKKAPTGYNIFLLNKQLFKDFNGYDETFCGHYGYEDVHLFDSFAKSGIEIKKIPYWYPANDLIIDRKTEYHSLIRDTKRNLELLQNKRKGLEIWHSKLSLNFEWEITEEHFCSKSQK